MKIKTRIYNSYFESILKNTPILPKYTHLSLSHENEFKMKKSLSKWKIYSKI